MNYEHEFVGKNTLKQVLEEAVEQIVRYKQLQGIYSTPQYLESKNEKETRREAV